MRYKVFFSKKGIMVHISHLDLMRLFQRAIRRAGLPFELTGGFSPHIKISMPRALKLGAESEREEFTFALKEERPPADIARLLNDQLPEGVRILEVKKYFNMSTRITTNQKPNDHEFI